MVGFDEEDVRGFLSGRVEKWKSFLPTQEHPCPSSITNYAIDDILATVAGTKPAASMIVYKTDTPDKVISGDASLEDVLTFVASRGVKWRIVDETIESATYLFFRTREQEIKYIYNTKMINQLNVFNPSDIEQLISFECANLRALGHQEDAIRDAMLIRRDHLIRNAHPLSESQALLLEQLKSSGWTDRVNTNKHNSDIDMT
jgi:hypothetical protein